MSFTDTDIAYFYYHPKCQTINNTQNPAGYNPQALFSCHIYGIRCRRALIFEFDLHVMKLLSKYFFNIRIGVSGFKAIYPRGGTPKLTGTRLTPKESFLHLPHFFVKI